MGRSTQGVKLINLDDGTLLAGIQKVIETDEVDPEIGSVTASETGSEES
jgi:DNA gyrase subunit A